MIVLISGSRNWTDPRPIREQLQKVGELTWLFHGAARGADSLAAQIAETMPLIRTQGWPADWKKHGQSAGFVRNSEMLRGALVTAAFMQQQPLQVLAFKQGFDREMRHGGTEHQCRIAVEAGCRVHLHDGVRWQRLHP